MKVLLPLVLASALLSGCNALQLGQPVRIEPGDWTTVGGTSARAHVATDGLAPPLEEVWRYDADAAFGPAAAVAADGVVLVTTKRGEMHAIDLETGRKRGVGDLKEPVTGAPVLTERMLYAPIAAGRRTIIAYDFVRGARAWTVEAGPVEAGLLIEAGTLVAAGLDGTVRALDPGTGEERWRARPDSMAGFFAAPVSLGSGRVAVADDRGRVSVFDLATGETLWTRALGRPVYATPAARDEHLFVPTTRGGFIVLDAATGSPLWTFDADEPTVRFSAPAVGEHLVIVGSSEGVLRAFDPTTGVLRWSFRTDGNFASAPLLTGAVVYVGALDETFYALDAESGAVLWETTLAGRVKSEPVLHDGILLVLAEPKFVYAFTAASPVAATEPQP